MSDLETQGGGDDLRSLLSSAFEAAETPTDAVEPEESSPSERLRDENGRFAKKSEPEEPVQETVQPEPEKVEEVAEEKPPEVPQKRPPSSWKKDAQAAWDTLPEHVKDDVLRRETDFHRGIEQYKTFAQKAQAYEQAIAPYQDTLKALGVPAEQAIGALFKADSILRHGLPHEKAAYFAQLAQEYGVPLEGIEQPPPVDPAYRALLNEVRQLRQSETQREQERQRAEMEQLNSTISKFAEGKEHFDAVRDDMAALLQAGRASDLEQAYDMAIWARPDLRTSLLEQQVKAAEEKARAEAQRLKAKTAAVSVKGSSPVSGTSATPTDLRALLEAQFNQS